MWVDYIFEFLLSNICMEKQQEFLEVYSKGDIEMVKSLISLDNSYTSIGLIVACRLGDIDLAKLMISLDATNWDEGLEIACEGGYIELVNLMMPNATNWNRGLCGACKGRHVEIIKLMINAGATKCNHCGQLINVSRIVMINC